MSGAWQDYVMRVIRLDEGEIDLWRRIAGMVSPCCRQIIEMMIKGEQEEMEVLRELCREHDVPCPDREPGYSYDPIYDPIPYTEKDKEGK